MTKKEYTNWLRTELTPYERGCYQYALYLNPKYVNEVYVKCLQEEWSSVYEFVKNNRSLLSIKHVPKKFKKDARRNIAASKALSSVKTVTISIAQ